MPHQPHETHDHQHGKACGHPQIETADGIAYAHEGHLHVPHDGHYDETVIPVSKSNPESCTTSVCKEDHAGGTTIPHGDHTDRLINGRLHHDHAGHCDDHGAVTVVGDAD